jgi:hypothetical protein
VASEGQSEQQAIQERQACLCLPLRPLCSLWPHAWVNHRPDETPPQSQPWEGHRQYYAAATWTPLHEAARRPWERRRQWSSESYVPSARNAIEVFSAAALCGSAVTETNRIYFVLFYMQNRNLVLYLAAINRMLMSV